jgi:Predicted choline kinase involved in LPS biosynthesis
MEIGHILGSGGSAEVYEYGNNQVLKLYYKGNKEGIVRWEYDKTANAYECGLPVPRVYEFLELDGRFGFVQDRIFGHSFLSEIISFIETYRNKIITGDEINSSERMRWIIKETARILYQIHTAKTDIMDTMEQSLSRMIENNEFLTREEKSKLLELAMALPQGDCICHGDPNPGNLVSDGTNTYLVDWISCIKGHRYYDITEYIQMYDFVDFPEMYMEEFIEKNKSVMVEIFIGEYERLFERKLNGLEAFYLPLLAAKLGGGCSYARKIKIQEKVREILGAPATLKDNSAGC